MAAAPATMTPNACKAASTRRRMSAPKEGRVNSEAFAYVSLERVALAMSTLEQSMTMFEQQARMTVTVS
jgi:hypothetical protein